MFPFGAEFGMRDTQSRFVLDYIASVSWDDVPFSQFGWPNLLLCDT